MHPHLDRAPLHQAQPPELVQHRKGDVLAHRKVTDDAALQFNHSDSISYGGVVSGTGSLEQAGSGTLILTGANTYSGGTTISAGTLAIGLAAAPNFLWIPHRPASR